MKVWQTKHVTFILASLLCSCLAHPLRPEDDLKNDPKQGKGDVQSADGFDSREKQTDPGNFLFKIQTWSDYLIRTTEAAENETTPQITIEKLHFSRKERSLTSLSEDNYVDSIPDSNIDSLNQNSTKWTQPQSIVPVRSSWNYSGNETPSHYSSSDDYYNINGSRSIDDAFLGGEEYPNQTDDSQEQEECGYETDTNAFGRVDKGSIQLLKSESNLYYIDQEEDYPQTPEDEEEKKEEERKEESHENTEEQDDDRRKRNIKNQKYSHLETGVSPNNNDNAKTARKILDGKENAVTTSEPSKTAFDNEIYNTTRSRPKGTTKVFVHKRSLEALDEDESKEDVLSKSTNENHETTSKDTKTESYIKERTRMSESKDNIDNEPEEDVLTTTMFETRNKSSIENRTESYKKETRENLEFVYKRSIYENDLREDITTSAPEITEESGLDTTTDVYYNKDTSISMIEPRRIIMNNKSESNMSITTSSENNEDKVMEIPAEAPIKVSTADKFEYKISIDGNDSKEDETTNSASKMTEESKMDTTTEGSKMRQ